MKQDPQVQQTLTPYHRFSAQGNAFLILEKAQLGATLTPTKIQHWAVEKPDLTFDQLLVVSADSSTHRCDVEIFNADGSSAEQCGNGMRAVAHFLFCTQGILDPTKYSLHPPAGEVRVIEFQAHNPSTAWVGVELPGPQDIQSTDRVDNTPCIAAYRVSMGNPHWILIWPHPPSAEECQSVGARLQSHESATHGINVSLAYWSGDRVSLRVFERGVGPTLACGSGACATTAAIVTHFNSARRLTVDQPGGSVVVHWPAGDAPCNPIELSGDVQRLNEGQLSWIET